MIYFASNTSCLVVRSDPGRVVGRVRDAKTEVAVPLAPQLFLRRDAATLRSPNPKLRAAHRCGHPLGT
jgi:glycine cleavage system pyridoxal-binding protein P